MHSMTRLVLCGLVLALAALPTLPTFADTVKEPATADNPFLTASPLPFQAPPFDKIQVVHFVPALTAGMQQQMEEMAAIASEAAPPTFANTLEAMERSGELLSRVRRVYSALADADTSDALQAVQAEMAPKLAAHRDAVYLDARLFARVRAVYEQREKLGLSGEQRRLAERVHRDFVRAGAQLGEADKVKLRALNQEEAKLSTEFRERLLAETNAAALVFDSAAPLAGLSPADLAAAAGEARGRGLEGKWVLSLKNTTQQPALASLRDRAVRERLLAASTGRGRQGGERDTRGIAARLAQLRAERAKLLGYPTYAAFALDDQMARTPAAAMKLLTDLAPAATGRARAEAAKMQALVDAQGGGFTLGAADWDFYAEQVRKAEFDLDEAEIRPYFDLERVVRDGVFFAATELYGITFKERKDLPVYHPDVRVYDVLDADGRPLALFYADFYARPSKSGGAWMDFFVDQSRLRGTKPVVYNVCNVTKPAPGEPALLSYDDVTTIFHEFGHALHGIFQDVTYPTVANVPSDFVELPSQFNERWALEPRVFANYARHYESGAPMPAALVAKIKKARTFNQGYATTEYVAASLLDLAWHDLPADAPLADVDRFEPATLERAGVALPAVPPRYRTTYFSHIWGGGYAAGYYSYLWAEVLVHDAFAWFEEHGGMTRANGQRYREMILARGGTLDAAEMYRAFRGRDASVEPLLEYRGLK
jgi:peptidyl-dipeptidase Dcp